MKHLGNCSPTEFFTQTVKIRKALEKWIKDIDLVNIRKTMPELTDSMSRDEKKAAIEEQGKKNLLKIIDAAMEEHPEETLEILALLCFVEPENVDDYPMTDYILAILEMIQHECVVNFFTLLLKLGKINISDVLKISG